MKELAILIIVLLGFVIGLFFFAIYRSANAKIEDVNKNVPPSFKIDDDGTIIRDLKKSNSHSSRSQYCYRCTAKLKAKTKFCPNCGASLS